MAMAPSPSAHAPAVLPVPLPPPPRAVAARARPVPVHPPALRARRGAALVASAALDDLHLLAIDEYPDGVLSGEWPENFSFLSYADLRAYLESQIVTSDQVRVRRVLRSLTSPALSCCIGCALGFGSLTMKAGRWVGR